MNITSMLNMTFSFNPKKIMMITGTKQQADDARVFLFGIANKPVPVPGKIDAFVASMPNKHEYAKLRFAANNRLFWVHGDSIRSVRALTEDEQVKHKTAKAVVFAGRLERFVKEDVATVIVAVNAAGGNL